MSPDRAYRLARFALAAFFITCGALGSSLFARQPALQQQYHLDALGWSRLLLSMGLGGLLAYPLTRWLLHHWGSRAMCLRCGILMGVGFGLIPFWPSLPMLQVALFVQGVIGSCVGVGINSQGALLELHSKQRNMGFQHAVFYVGTFTGAILAALATRAKLAMAWHFPILGVLVVIVFAFAHHWLLMEAPKPGARGHMFQRPSRAVLWLGALGCMAAMTESAVNGWLPAYFNQILHAGETWAAVSLALFALAATVGRFCSDANAERWGASRLVSIGGYLAATGLGLATLFGRLDGMLVGLVLVGLGHAAVFPLLFSATGRHGAAAIPAVASMASFGSLAGPWLLGRLADQTSIQWVMFAISGCFVLLALLARALQPLPAATGAP